jgi:hypothetical protein
VIQANTALDSSVDELKQSMELAAAWINCVDATTATLSSLGHVDICMGSPRPKRHHPQNCNQGVGTGEDDTSGLVRGQRFITHTENFVLRP